MEKSPLILKQLELGPMDNYVYIIGDESTKDCVIVDPAWDIDTVRELASQEGLNIKAALITHGHPDHTNGIEELLKTHDIPIYVSEHEASFYRPIGENISEVKPSDKFELGAIDIEFLHTPGHTPGSQCFLIKSPKATYHGSDEISFDSNTLLISGDTLFLDGCGRCDLPGGDAEVLFSTIQNTLLKLPSHTVIFPGHNYHHLCCDSLERQKQSNPYLRFDNLHGFIGRRLG
jgi:hydroxyacylglutathione hydrolase